MRILFAAHRVPFPPNKGDKLRSFNEIVFLSKNHDIDLFCLAHNDTDLGYKQELEKYCRSVTIVREGTLISNIRASMALLGRGSFTRAYFRSPRLQAAISAALTSNNYDAVFVYCSSMASYFEKRCSVPRIIDFVDVDSEKWKQYVTTAPIHKKLLYTLESRRLKRYEQLIAKTYRFSFFVSEHEARDFRTNIYNTEAVLALSNGVDTKRFFPGDGTYENNRIVFTGAMDYFANIATVQFFVDKILPRIASRIPDVHFFIVGSNPDAAVYKLQESEFAVTVTGAVESILPYLHDAAVFAAPMQIARGVQNKILESMAAGVPVVTNSRGFEGISAAAGNDLIVADDVNIFAEACIEIMQNPQVRRQLSENGLVAINSAYSWEKNLTPLDVALRQCIR